MTFEKIVCVAATTCDGCLDGIYPGEGYWTTEERRARACSADCQREIVIKQENAAKPQEAV